MKSGSSDVSDGAAVCGLISRIFLETQSLALSNTNHCSEARRRRRSGPFLSPSLFDAGLGLSEGLALPEPTSLMYL